jgi:hypothetical protein
VNPSLGVITAAGFPSNEPIDEQWASLVVNLGIRLFRQDRTGAVRIRLEKESLSAEGFLNGVTFKQ